MTGYPHIKQNITRLLGSILLAWSHLHKLGEVINHHENTGISTLRLAYFLVVNLDDLVETATHYILQRESLGSRRTLRVLTKTASSYALLDRTVQSGPDETLFDSSNDFVHALMALVIMRAEDHFSMEQLRQYYRVVIIDFLL